VASQVGSLQSEDLANAALQVARNAAEDASAFLVIRFRFRKGRDQKNPVRVMNKKEDPTWLPDQAEKLQFEAFIAEIQKLRTGADNHEKRKPWWQTMLESTGGTALITVIIGGLVGAIITGMIQSGAKDREFEQAWIKARGDQALIAYKDYLEQQRDTVKRAYELVGNCISASDDLIDLTGPDFDPTQYSGLEKQRVTLRQNYNNCDRQWRGQRDMFGLLVTYYHHGEPRVIDSWELTKDSVSKFMDCATEWYLSHNDKPSDTSGACKTERESLQKNLVGFGKAVDEARHFAWEGWESPEALRSNLKAKR